MKRNELKAFDVMVCDYSWLGDGRMTDVCYVVMFNDNGHKLAVSFHGNGNDPKDGNRGWYDLDGNEGEFELPVDCVAVYRPRYFADTFHGDFESAVDYADDKLYDCIYRKKGE